MFADENNALDAPCLPTMTLCLQRRMMSRIAQDTSPTLEPRATELSGLHGSAWSSPDGQHQCLYCSTCYKQHVLCRTGDIQPDSREVTLLLGNVGIRTPYHTVCTRRELYGYWGCHAF